MKFNKKNLQQWVVTCRTIMPRLITTRTMNRFFLHELRLDSTFPRSSRRSLCGWRIKKGISMTQGITNGSIFINHWHVMRYQSTHASRVYLLLQIVLIPVINIIRYIKPHSPYSCTSMITWDSRHLPCFTCASLLH